MLRSSELIVVSLQIDVYMVLYDLEYISVSLFLNLTLVPIIDNKLKLFWNFKLNATIVRKFSFAYELFYVKNNIFTHFVQLTDVIFK